MQRYSVGACARTRAWRRGARGWIVHRSSATLRAVRTMWLAAFAGLGLAQLGTSAALYSETDRLRQLQVSSGLLPEAVRLQSKYDPTAGTLPPFPNDTAGTFFSGVFSDHTVLQREPAKAVVFGVLFGAQSSTTVTVTVVDVVPANGATMYSVQADVMLSDIQMPSGRYAKWKAYLKPTPAGGNFTISVSCASCTNTTVTTINDVTFGDVWFCSGQYYTVVAALHTRFCPQTKECQLVQTPGRHRCHCRCRSIQHVVADEHGHQSQRYIRRSSSREVHQHSHAHHDAQQST